MSATPARIDGRRTASSLAPRIRVVAHSMRWWSGGWTSVAANSCSIVPSGSRAWRTLIASSTHNPRNITTRRPSAAALSPARPRTVGRVRTATMASLRRATDGTASTSGATRAVPSPSIVSVVMATTDPGDRPSASSATRCRPAAMTQVRIRRAGLLVHRRAATTRHTARLAIPRR